MEQNPYCPCDGNFPGSKSLLVLDEDESSSQDLKQRLEDVGHRIELRPSIGDFPMAKLDLAKFDMVICDSDNGQGVWKFLLARIRVQRLNTQLVLTSQKAAETEWLEALQLGVFDLLVKPYSKSEVLRITANALTTKYSHNFKTA
jgi:DNA-binding NtrC family response regulator